jgi:hypothetical protein
MLLAAQHKNEGPVFTRFTKYGNFAFTYSFCLELLLKLIALGPRKFWADGWNRFDLLVVAGSVMDLNVKSVNIGARVSLLRNASKLLSMFQLYESNLLFKCQMREFFSGCDALAVF